MEYYESIVVCNAFSLNMLADLSRECVIEVLPRTVEDIRGAVEEDGLRLESAVGHPDTAALFSHLLGVNLEAKRVNLTLGPGDQLLVGQYRGPRLPEGATELPEGATIEWCLVEVR